jgi:hypothetical protein
MHWHLCFVSLVNVWSKRSTWMMSIVTRWRQLLFSIKRHKQRCHLKRRNVPLEVNIRKTTWNFNWKWKEKWTSNYFWSGEWTSQSPTENDIYIVESFKVNGGFRDGESVLPSRKIFHYLGQSLKKWFVFSSSKILDPSLLRTLWS